MTKDIGMTIRKGIVVFLPCWLLFGNFIPICSFIFLVVICIACIVKAVAVLERNIICITCIGMAVAVLEVNKICIACIKNDSCCSGEEYNMYSMHRKGSYCTGEEYNMYRYKKNIFKKCKQM